MPLLQVIVLSFLQGITEFLPISSTAHLALAPWMFGWKDPGLAFDVALHVGTLLAVSLYFFKTWINLLLLGFGRRPVFVPEGPSPRSGSDLTENRALLWFLVIATIPAAIAGWLFHEQVESTWRHPLIVAGALIVVALLMAWGEKAGRQLKELPAVGLADSLIVGFCQALALVPGVSRSGITITGALFRNLTRESAARFSFLLSTPIIAGAALKEFLDFPDHRVPQPMQLAFLVGMFVSAFVGYLTISFFLKYLQFGTFKIFIYYRIILGIAVLSIYFLGGGAF